jgi:hypothetical protein
MICTIFLFASRAMATSLRTPGALCVFRPTITSAISDRLIARYAMTPAERMDLDEAVTSLLRAKRASHNDAVRLKRDAREWLDGIRARRKREPAGPTLAEYVAGRKSAETAR